MSTITTHVSDKELAAAIFTMGGDERVSDALVENRDRMERMGINNAYRWACFIGQCAHESAGFTVFEENLNYSEQAVMRVWPSRFTTRASARRVARNPEALANAVYGGRMGNGMGNGDGWRYRGRGPIQLTGKQNYALAGAYLGIDLIGDPDILSEDPEVGLLVAAWFFTQHTYKGLHIIEWADTLNHRNITRRINGGEHGLSDRIYLSATTLDTFDLDEGRYKKPIVRFNSKGKSVKEIQRILKDLDYLPGKVDGHFGQGTRDAVMSFQRIHGLTPDGIIGTQTYGKMVEQTLLT